MDAHLLGPALAGILLLSACAVAQATPPAGLEKTVLWRAGQGGYETWRIPGIVVTARGTVFAYAVGRAKLADADWSDSVIHARRSEDGGATWQGSRLVAGTGEGVTDNPVAIPDAVTGALHLLYQTDYSRCHYIRSDDDGRTFSKPVDITDVFQRFQPEFTWNVLAPSVGHAIQTRTGRLVVPVWLANGRDLGQGRRSHAPSATATIYSDDHGKTWKRGDIVARDSAALPNPNEAMAVELADGRVMINMRNGSEKNRRAVSISPDGAGRWSAPYYDEGLFDPICAASIVRANGALLFSNPDSGGLPESAEANHRLRRNLTWRLSRDGGKTWPISRVVEPGSSGYSDLCITTDGAIAGVYESWGVLGTRGNSIVLARAPMDWLDRPPPGAAP